MLELADLTRTAGAEVVGPTSSVCPGEIYTDSQGMQPHSAPRAMTVPDIAHTVEEYARSAQLAIEAGFDGVEPTFCPRWVCGFLENAV